MLDRPRDYVVPMAVCLFCGGLFTSVALLWSLGLAVVNQKVRPVTTEDWGTATTIFGFGLVALWLSWGFLRRPHTITVSRDGTLKFHRIVGTIAIDVNSIQELKRSQKLISLEGEDERGVWVWHASGWVVVPNFPQIEELIADIVRLNPRISRTGSWPPRD